jgi:hypothetical protein
MNMDIPEEILIAQRKELKIETREEVKQTIKKMDPVTEAIETIKSK